MNDTAAIRPSAGLLDSLLTETAAQHKHLCPRQVLGVRMGLYGLRLLELTDAAYSQRFINQKKRLLAIVETDGCGADGVAVATDCYVGRRSLRVLDFGKMAVTLIDTRQFQGRADRDQLMQGVRITPHPTARSQARQCAPEASSRWHAYLEAYQIIPDDLLLQVQPVVLTQTLAEILSRPGVRENCTVCGEEIINERELLLDGRIVCRGCAGDAYYRPRE